MIRITEKYYIKRVITHKSTHGKKYNEYGRQKIKKTVYWFLWVVPIYIKNEVLDGDYESQ